MPVDSVHEEYAYLAPLWQRARHGFDGEYVIKAHTTEYLPMLPGMEDDDYTGYLLNARYYNAFARTIEGLRGTALRIPPMIEGIPDEWQADISLAGLSIDAFIKKDLEEKLQTGRYGIRVDMREGGSRPYFSAYAAENITHWFEDIVDGQRVPTMVRVREWENVPGKDEFEQDRIEVYHVLDLDQSGLCRLRIFRQVGTNKQWIGEEQPPPNRMGERLDFIPFFFDGVSDTTPSCEKPPLLDLLSVNLGHYRLTADYYDAILFTSKPQPWVSGAGDKKELKIGSRYAWMLQTGAQVGYLEYSGAGIADIRQGLLDDEARMARLGASVIEEPKKGIEAAETARINQSGKTSLLASITGTTGQAITTALQCMAWWGGLTNNRADPNIKCTMNQDFVEARMTPDDLLKLVQSWQQRGISQQTLLYNIKRGGLLPEDVTISDEISLIETEAPPMPPGPEEDLDEEEEQEEAA